MLPQTFCVQDILFFSVPDYRPFKYTQKTMTSVMIHCPDLGLLDMNYLNIKTQSHFI